MKKVIFILLVCLLATTVSAQYNEVVYKQLSKKYKAVKYDDRGYYFFENKRGSAGVADNDGNVLIEPKKSEFVPNRFEIVEKDGHPLFIKGYFNRSNNKDYGQFHTLEGHWIDTGIGGLYTDPYGFDYIKITDYKNTKLFTLRGDKILVADKGSNLEFHRESNNFGWITDGKNFWNLMEKSNAGNPTEGYKIFKKWTYHNNDVSEWMSVLTNNGYYWYYSVNGKPLYKSEGNRLSTEFDKDISSEIKNNPDFKIAPERKPIKPQNVEVVFPITKGTGSLLMASQTGLMIVPESVYVCGVSRIPGSNTGTLRLVFTLRNTTDKIIDNFQFALSSESKGALELPKARYINRIYANQSAEMWLLCVFSGSHFEFELTPVVKGDTRTEGVKATLNL